MLDKYHVQIFGNILAMWCVFSDPELYTLYILRDNNHYYNSVNEKIQQSLCQCSPRV